MTKLDRRRKYYLILDCETATLPYVANYNGEIRKSIAIAKPLIYDLGWQIVDNRGRVYKRESFLISEIFSVPAIFNTAYYASKRPIYLDRLRHGETTLTDWRTAVSVLVEDLEAVEAVGAYNSIFDFKKAIPFTELYINMLYSPDFYKWEKMQNAICDEIAHSRKWENKRSFDENNFIFRECSYPLFDLWGLTVEHLLNNDDYKQMCIDNKWQTASGKYFSTSAETAYRFFSGNIEFDESHTAIDDAEIESELFAAIHKVTKGKWDLGIAFFPFRILGTVESFEMR